MAPMKTGMSAGVVSSNIKEMMKSGRPQKQAIAAALRMKRKSKMESLAEGGEVSDIDTDEGSESEPGMPTYPMGDDAEGLSESVMDEQMLAEGLQKARMAANDNSVDYDPYYQTKGAEMHGDAQRQPEKAQPLGNKPDLDYINDGTEEPMSMMPDKPGPMEGAFDTKDPSGPGLSSEALEALKKKKMTRRYGSYSPS